MSAALQFDPASHEYRLEGRRLPSVTEILDPYTGLEYVDRSTLEAARELGTHVHEAVHLYNTGRLAHCPERIVPYLEGWKAFLAESGAVVTASEMRVHSDEHQYAGTLDSLAYWTGRDCLIDVKSGSIVPKTVGPQTSAYVDALNEQHGTRVRLRYCIHLTGDGRYRSHKLTDVRDRHIFQSALNIHNWYRSSKK
jgi:hypothetical protein